MKQTSLIWKDESEAGAAPAGWKERDHKPLIVPPAIKGTGSITPKTRQVIGMDVFVEADQSASELGSLLTKLGDDSGFKLKMLSNRGTQVFPARGAETDCVNHWRCRFLYGQPDGDVPLDRVNRLLGAIQAAGLRWMHIEKLQEFDGKPAYTKAQGED